MLTKPRPPRLQQSVGAKLEAAARKVSLPFGGGAGATQKQAPMKLKPPMKKQSTVMGIMNIAANMGAVSLPKMRLVVRQNFHRFQ